MNVSELRPEFLSFINRNCGASPDEVAAGATEVPTRADDAAETYLPDVASKFTINLQTQDDLFRDSKLHPDHEPHNDELSQASKARVNEAQREHPQAFDLMETVLDPVGDQLEMAMPAAWHGGSDGIFGIDLRQSTLMDDHAEGLFDKHLGVLFVDTTPGKDNVVTYLHKIPGAEDPEEALFRF